LMLIKHYTLEYLTRRDNDKLELFFNNKNSKY
jgi:hypothetical protein